VAAVGGRKLPKSTREVTQKNRIAGCQDWGGGFRRVFEALVGLIKRRHELGFIVEIASF